MRSDIIFFFFRKIQSIFLTNSIDLCHHKRSVSYWCESLNTNETMAFYAKKRLPNNETDIVVMGIGCSATANGSYYLITDSNPPYSLGMNGTDCSWIHLQYIFVQVNITKSPKNIVQINNGYSIQTLNSTIQLGANACSTE